MMLWLTLLAITLFRLTSSEHVSKRQANQELRVVTILQKPYLMTQRDSDGNLQDGKYEGYIPDLMDALATYMDLPYTFQLVKDGRYGGREADGTWNGLVGEVVKGEADIAAAPLTITSSRARVVDFTKPFMNTGITTLFRRPARSSAPFMWLLQPFPIEVWILILLITALSCVFLYVLNRFVPAPRTGEAAGTCQRESQLLCGSVAKLMGIQSDQAVWRSLFALTWRTFVLFTSVLYVSCFIPFAASSSDAMMPPPYGSFDDLAKSNLKFGYIKSGSTHAFFRSSTIPAYAKIYARVSASSPSTLVNSTKEGIERVTRGGYAMIGESTTLEYATGFNCELMRVGSVINSIGYGLATPIGSSHREQLNLAILELQENGLLQQLHNKWWSEKAICDNTAFLHELPAKSKVPKYRALTTSEFVNHGTIVLLVIGFVLTGVAAVVEALLQRKQRGSDRSSKVEIIAETSA